MVRYHLNAHCYTLLQSPAQPPHPGLASFLLQYSILQYFYLQRKETPSHPIFSLQVHLARMVNL